MLEVRHFSVFNAHAFVILYEVEPKHGIKAHPGENGKNLK